MYLMIVTIEYKLTQVFWFSSESYKLSIFVLFYIVMWNLYK